MTRRTEDTLLVGSSDYTRMLSRKPSILPSLGRVECGCHARRDLSLVTKTTIISACDMACGGPVRRHNVEQDRQTLGSLEFGLLTSKSTLQVEIDDAW